MQKVVIVCLAALLGGCNVYPETIKDAEAFCANHGGLSYIEVGSNPWDLKDKIVCVEEGVSKVVRFN